VSIVQIFVFWVLTLCGADGVSNMLVQILGERNWVKLHAEVITVRIYFRHVGGLQEMWTNENGRRLFLQNMTM